MGLLTLPPLPPQAAQAQTPRAQAQTEAAQSSYGKLLQQELAALGLDPKCARDSPTAEHCRYLGRSSLTERRLPVHAIYNAQTDSVYLYFEHFLKLPPAAAHSDRLLRRLMELNWHLLVGKFEWNSTSGEVRLSAVLSTDSNFDRRALRSVVKALDETAARYRPELLKLQEPSPAPDEGARRWN